MAQPLHLVREEAVPAGDETPATSWRFEPGAEIAPGRSVVSRLGGGSRYEVWLAWDDRLFALVVAKLVRPDQVDDPHALREIERERDVLARLAHPVLLRGFGAVTDGPHPHLLLEHLEGPTLSRLLRWQGALPLEQLLPLALHVASALHYLAAERIVHLDVKPSNIVMGLPPRLIDLSIARSFESAQRLRQPIGTDAYMAPEQCDPASFPGRIGPATDVFGLGATLHHAISGSVPFPRAHGARSSEDLATRFPQLVRPPVALGTRVPEPIRNLVTAMLAPDPAERPAAADVASALEPIVASIPRKLTVSRRGVRTR